MFYQSYPLKNYIKYTVTLLHVNGQSIFHAVLTFSCYQFILLGAVPFPADVPRLKELGVSRVVTLNEPYETLVPTCLYNVSNSVVPFFFPGSHHWC